jgi:hypothetical protein
MSIKKKISHSNPPHRPLKYGEPTKVLRVRVPESHYNKIMNLIKKYLKPLIR